MGDSEGLSIEETNKLRAALGLKPLKVGPPPKETTPADDERIEAERKQREQEVRDAEVAARLEKVKAKRAITARIQGSALGEELANDAELDDAAAWVARQKQRKVEETTAAAPRPAKRERRDDGHKYDEKDLKDMQVGHKFDSIQEGETLILTLADAPVLDSKTRVMNDAADVLENVSIRDKERHAKIEEEKKRIKSGRVYDPYAENKSILSQYDEEEERVTFSLSSAVAEAPSRDEVKARLAALPSVSLSGDKVVASEYLTAEESKFRVPKAKKIVRKKKTSSLVKELEEAASAEQSGSAAAVDAPPTSDHGSRSEVGATREADDAAAKAERIRIQRENYEKAQQKATAASAILLPSDLKKKPAAAPVTVKKEKLEADDVFHDDAEEEMLAAVNAARAKNQVIRPADIAEQVLARRAIKKEDEDQKDPFAASKSADVTFSSTTEFLRAVHAPASQAQTAAAKSAAAAAAAAKAAAAAVAAMEIDEVVRAADPEAMAEKDEDEDKEKEEDDGSDDGPAMPAEPQVGRSMTDALAYVQQRASGLEKDLEVYSGRKSDKPIRPQEQGPGEVRLMYVDEFGSQMTPKEAWRHMCHAFHGKHPSKNKREKMLKRREAMLAAKREGGTADLVSQVNTMMKTQEKLQSPFIVVSSSTPAPLIAAALAAKKEPAAPPGPVKMESFSLKPKSGAKR